MVETLTAARSEELDDNPRARVLGFDVAVARTRWARLFGLAMLDRDQAGPGLLIPDCRSVHTFGMRFDLDLIFLDDAERVIDLRPAVPPRRVVRCKGATSVLELPSP